MSAFAAISGIEGQNAPCELVHDVAAGRLQDHVLGKGRRHLAGIGENLVELRQLFRLRKAAEEEQIGHLFKAERPGLLVRVDDVLHADTAIVELAGHGLPLAIDHVIALHAADLADANEHAGAVVVAQAALDVLILIQLRRDGILLNQITAHLRDILLKTIHLHLHDDPLLFCR